MIPTSTKTRQPTFHEILDQKGITLGVVVDNSVDIAADGRIVADNFNQLAIGYFSWGWIRRHGPAVSTIDFAWAEEWVAFAQSRGMRVTNGNALVYNVDLPEWLTEGSFSPEQMREIITDHVSAAVGHFKGRVAEWIVANEAYIYYHGHKGIQTQINETGAPLPFAAVLGEEYIELAYRAAREADPTAVLIYNDWGIELPGPKADWIFDRVRTLKQKGLLDAVGMQYHFTTPTLDIGSPILDAANPPRKEELISQIRRYKEIGVDVVITELDVDLRHLPGTEEQKWEKAAELYEMVLEACLEGGCNSVTVWGLNGSDSVHLAGHAALLFSDNQPTPAFDAIQKVVIEY